MIEIPPRTVYEGSMWVPWADDWDSAQRLQLVIADSSYFQIWQKGNRLAFRTEAELARLQGLDLLRAEYDNAPGVPGESSSGGRRHLHVEITTDGRPFFKLEADPN